MNGVEADSAEPFTPVTTCPSCEAPSSVSFTREEERFPYGPAPHTVELTVVVDKGRCAVCAFEFTDWRVEEAHDEVVQIYRVLQVARGMLQRYSSAKAAMEMAHWHAMDHAEGSDSRARWLRVRETIERLSKEAGSS